MKLAIDAIYENGSFRPIQQDQIRLNEGAHVRLIVDEPAIPEILKLASEVYAGMSPAEIDEIERIACERGGFFRTRSED